MYKYTKIQILFLFLQPGGGAKGGQYYPGGSQTLPRGGMYSDRNKNVVGKYIFLNQAIN